jgi:hypothetical protein
MFATLLSSKHNQESFHGCEETFKGSITCIASSTRRRDSLAQTLAGKVHPHPPFLINLSPFDLTLHARNASSFRLSIVQTSELGLMFPFTSMECKGAFPRGSNKSIMFPPGFPLISFATSFNRT